MVCVRRQALAMLIISRARAMMTAAAPTAMVDPRRGETASRCYNFASQNPLHPSARRQRCSVEPLAANLEKHARMAYAQPQALAVLTIPHARAPMIAAAPIATLDSRRRGTAFRYQDSAGQSPSHPSARRPRASVEQLAAKQTKAAMSPLRHAVQQTQYLTAPFGDLSVARNAAQLERPAQMESANRAVGRLEAPVSDLKTVAATTVPFSGSRREVPHLGYVGRPPRLPPPTAPVKDQSAVPTAAPKEKPARMESANRAVAKKLPTVSRTQTVAATTASPPGSVLEGSSVQLGLVGPSLIAPVKDRCAPGGAAN